MRTIPAIVVVPVVPVRMLEAWLLSDESALRTAAGNPNGRRPLELPRIQEIESLPDPKGILHDLLRQASELGSRRRRNVEVSAIRVAERTEDFSRLRGLQAFRALEAEVLAVLQQLGGLS
jgi:hypothetical protein